jgi:hypothetical protein
LLGEHALDHGDALVGGEGFDQVAREPGGAHLGAIAFCVAGREHEHRGAGGARLALERVHELEAGHARHVVVGHHELEGFVRLEGLVEAILTVDGGGHLEPLAAEGVAHQMPDGRRVVHHEQPLPAAQGDLGQQIAHTREQVLSDHGFDEVVVGADVETLLEVRRLTEGAADHDRQARTIGVALDGVADLVAVLAGHLHVGDDQVRRVLHELPQGLLAVVGMHDLVALFLEDRRRMPMHEVAVVREQDERLVAGRHTQGLEHLLPSERHVQETRQARRARALAVLLVGGDEHQRHGRAREFGVEGIATWQAAGDEGHDRSRLLAEARAKGLPVLHQRRLVARLTQGLGERVGEDLGGGGDDDVHGGGNLPESGAGGARGVTRARGHPAGRP